METGEELLLHSWMFSPPGYFTSMRCGKPSQQLRLQSDSVFPSLNCWPWKSPRQLMSSVCDCYPGDVATFFATHTCMPTQLCVVCDDHHQCYSGLSFLMPQYLINCGQMSKNMWSCVVMVTIVDLVDVLRLHWTRAQRIQIVASSPHDMVSVIFDIARVSSSYGWYSMTFRVSTSLFS